MTQKVLKKKLEEIWQKADECRMALEEIRDDLQEQYDKHSEKWQEGEKGEIVSSALEEIQQHYDVLEELCSVDYGLLED